MIHPSLLDAVRAWQADDPDPATVAELDALVDAGDEAALRDRFGARLTFGTAGLRGPLGAGPNRMNRVVVRRTAAALGRWLADREVEEHAVGEFGAEGPVVVGRDARHGSSDFADDTAQVLAAMGRPVIRFLEPVPTPLLAYAVWALDAVAGVMVTASHNPPQDNGYKVYVAGGRQIVPPIDAEISDHVDAIGPVSGLTLADLDDVLITSAPAILVDDYLDGVARLRREPDATPVRVAYTPLHGVGRDLVVAAFERCGLPAPVVVDDQAEPDPDFPTVAFPNPEEPGAMDAVIATGIDAGVDLALANDPDADRLAVAVNAPDGWRRLTGDQVGILLADHLLRSGSGPDRLVATTVVSSTMLSSLAAAHGVLHAETLTGFKWLALAAESHLDHEFVLGYEEALGYSIGRLVADKDGISAAVVFCELAGDLADRGVTVLDRLDELAVEHGQFTTDQWTAQFDGTDGPLNMAAVVDRFRTDPPATVGGVAITEVEDLALGERLPSTDAVILRGGGLRVIVRPSGTEPKLKVYVEAVEPVNGPEELAEARRRARSRIDAALADVRGLVGSS